MPRFVLLKLVTLLLILLTGPSVGLAVAYWLTERGLALWAQTMPPAPPGWIAGLVAAVVCLGLVAVCGAAFAARLKECFDVQNDGDDAEQRGRELLLRLLTPEQRKQFNNTGNFVVDVAGGHQAIIGRSITGVQWRSRNGRSMSQCVYTPNVIKDDDVIAKLLALRNNPRGVAAISRFWNVIDET